MARTNVETPNPDPAGLSLGDTDVSDGELPGGLTREQLPTHVAMIMDGNGRWARSRGLGRSDGHRAGAKAVRRVVVRCRELHIPYLTLYAFSAQNWKRPANEVSQLMALLVEFCEGERSLLNDKNIRFRVIGDKARLPEEARQAVSFLEEATEDHTAMQLVLALSYGGREELVHAAKRIAHDVASGALNPDDINEQVVAERLWTADIPDPDVVVRSSGELRVSNFLLWQIAYAELVPDTRCWPEFDAAAFDDALVTYAQRNRRFGGV
ncbi:MAG: di-trans,poly-cis-decaprenylcistransferase [Myxococcales bacterium]|nr:di-trans,poly-cis-decaprenylcistransferase [Myxococcales bacterium]